MGIRVAVRADASRRIGLGHVKRCLSLARALKELGADVVLVTRNLGVDVSKMASALSVRVVILPKPDVPIAPDDREVLHRDWAEVSWLTDAKECIAALAGEGSIDWLVVDHYAFDSDWHDALRAALGCKVAVVDDLADRPISPDLLVDHNFSDNHRSKYAPVLGSGSAILGGPRFALLAPNYASAQRFMPGVGVRSIGIFMGGVDVENWSEVAWSGCREHAAFAGPIEIASTSENPNLPALHAVCARDPGTTVLLDAPDLASFFCRHDLQIGAGGGALLERACIGAPTLAFACALNQVHVISDLARIGAIATLEEAGPPSGTAIGRRLQQILDDAPARKALSERSRALVDGRGTQRVALVMLRDRLFIRAATFEDSMILFAWRNHESTRAMSMNPSLIKRETHEKWLRETIEGQERHLLVAMVGGLAVGAIRFDDLTPAEVEVSLYLDPELHGLGLGRAMLGAGEKYVSNRKSSGTRIVARVLTSNVASQKLFAAAGFHPIGDGRLAKRVGH